MCVAADVDGVIEATKKKRANKKQRYQESKYLQEHGAELLRGGRAEVDGDCCDNCRRKNFSSDPRYTLEFEVVSNTEIRANTLAKVKPKNRHTPVMEYSLCQECVRFLKKPDNYAVMTAFQNAECALGSLWRDFCHRDDIGQQGPLRSK